MLAATLVGALLVLAESSAGAASPADDPSLALSESPRSGPVRSGPAYAPLQSGPMAAPLESGPPTAGVPDEPSRAEPPPAGLLSPPAIVDAGFVPPRPNLAGISGGHIWLALDRESGTYLLEPVGGRAPSGLADLWGRPLPAAHHHLVVPLNSPTRSAAPGGAEPLWFGFEIRAVDSAGRIGPPSAPVWVSASPVAGHRGPTPPRSDHILFLLLFTGLAMVWTWYRREETAEGKIRLAALGALASVVFLAVTAAMPWLSVGGGAAGGDGSILCLLGQEGVCVARAGSNPLSGAGAVGHTALTSVAFEVQRWQCASAALRMGQITALALLLPALIWLLVDPRHRAAQASTAVGASVAAFTFMVVLLYQHAMPSWLDARVLWTDDIALLASASIVVAAVLVVRQSFALLGRPTALPRAISRPRRKRGRGPAASPR